MKKKMICIAVCVLICCTALLGCTAGPLDPGNPVTVTLWHNYGGQMKTTMDELVDEFNSTVGHEKGIILSVTSISSSATLQEKLDMAANGDPGAPALPDITTCYPKTALNLKENEQLCDLSEQFTEEELSAYVPRFLEEGTIDGDLYVFPIAKSTEVLFVNQTLFDRFAAESGVTLEDLSTFEGIADAARKYYDWTDAKTPEVPLDGKAFYAADSLFNLAQVGMEQIGQSLLSGQSLDLSTEGYRRIWDFYFDTAVAGGAAIYDGYSSDLSKTGDIVCSTGSTAGILFYGDEITYPDNITEKVEYTVLPYPVFAGGEKIAIQRGGGMCVTSSTPEKEYAAAVFLKWFTAPEQNMKFVSSTGYLPVTQEAFDNILEEEMDAIENKNIQKLLMAAATMQREYDFYIPPTFAGFDEIGNAYEEGLRAKVKTAQAGYEAAVLSGEAPEAAFERAADGAQASFTEGLVNTAVRK